MGGGHFNNHALNHYWLSNLQIQYQIQNQCDLKSQNEVLHKHTIIFCCVDLWHGLTRGGHFENRDVRHVSGSNFQNKTSKSESVLSYITKMRYYTKKHLLLCQRCVRCRGERRPFWKSRFTRVPWIARSGAPDILNEHDWNYIYAKFGAFG